MSQTKAQLVTPLAAAGIVTAAGVVATGVVTATSFDGDVVGSATSIISGGNLNVGIISATNFSGDFTGSATGIITSSAIKVGQLTASSFVGDFTGTATSMMRGTGFEAGAVNATGFVANVTGDVTGNATGLAGSVTSGGNIHVGVMTATSYYGNGSNLTGIAGTSFNTQVVAVATFSIDVTSPAGGNYTLSGNDRNGSVSGSDPTVTIDVGDTLSFVVDASGHPFYLRVSDGGSNVGGATNQGTQSGTVSWTPNTAGTYYYQCGNHAGMIGTIIVNDRRTIDLSAGNMITFNQSASKTVAFANTSTAMDVSMIRATVGTYNISYSTGRVDFDGTDDTLTIAASNDFVLDGDFTIEGWFYPQGYSTYNALWCLGSYNNAGGIIFYQKSSNGNLELQKRDTGGGGYTTPFSVTAPGLNVWTHVAVARSGSTITVYLNGESQGSWTDSDDWGTNTNKTFQIGSALTDSGNDVDFWNGIISNFRLVKGTAVYTSDFIPPSEPLNNITNTKLLCCQSSSSTTASVVTPATITAVSSPTADTTTVSKSGTVPSETLTITWPDSVNWNGGSAPTLISSGGVGIGTQQFQFITRDSGVTWYAWESFTTSSSSSTFEDGTLWAWGRNESGELGQNDTSDRSSPTQVGTDTTWGSKEDGVGLNQGGDEANDTNNILQTKSDGTLWAWGKNEYGQLGFNDRTDYSSPVQVGADTSWVMGYSNARDAGGIKDDGTLWSWGKNEHGLLGLNQAADTCTSSPTQVGTDTTWSATDGHVCVSLRARCMIKTDGTLWAWGNKYYGVLGLNQGGSSDNEARSSPVQIGTDTTWSKTKVNFGTMYGIKTDGSLWSWGKTNYGELGQNEARGSDLSSPTQVGTKTNWSDITSMYVTTFAFNTSGEMYTWGYTTDGYGGLNGNGQWTSSPTQVPGTTWVAGSAYRGANAVKTDGTLWGWSVNDWGNVGTNNTTQYSSPIQIGSDTDWDTSPVRIGAQYKTKWSLKTS